jgi:serine/threonine protein kinase
MEYVEGENLSSLIAEIVDSEAAMDADKALSIFEQAGDLLARVHAVGVALGDTKPENFLVTKSGEIMMLDFEQASRKGDRAWDIAEFLYYAGHDIPPFAEARRVEEIGKSFVHGYLKAGGNVKLVNNAGNPKYTKVFSVFTFPRIMLLLSNVCRRANEIKE